jgi:hypothetical protein
MTLLCKYNINITSVYLSHRKLYLCLPVLPASSSLLLLPSSPLPQPGMFHLLWVLQKMNFTFLLWVDKIIVWKHIPLWILRDRQWHSWLRNCTTSQKVTDLFPSGVFGIFHWHNTSGCPMALGSTEPLTEISTRKIFWRVKATSA